MKTRFQFFALLLLSLCSGLFQELSADNTDVKPSAKGKIRCFERTMIMDADTGAVFIFMDNIENTGSHMTKKSGAMAGSKLQLEWLTPFKTGPGTRYRWRGKVLGMRMDFTVEVNKWVKNKSKVWGTVGQAKMIVIDSFEMYLELTPLPNGKTQARLGIHYTKSGNIPGVLFGRSYAKWCVNSMLRDTRKHFRVKPHKS